MDTVPKKAARKPRARKAVEAEGDAKCDEPPQKKFRVSRDGIYFKLELGIKKYTSFGKLVDCAYELSTRVGARWKHECENYLYTLDASTFLRLVDEGSADPLRPNFEASERKKHKVAKEEWAYNSDHSDAFEDLSGLIAFVVGHKRQCKDQNADHEASAVTQEAKKTTFERPGRPN